jgi:alpha-L-fucosidase
VPAYAARPAPYCTRAGIPCPKPALNRSAPSSCGPCQGPSRCTQPDSQYCAGEWYPHCIYVKGTPSYEHHVKTYGASFGYKDFIPQFTAPKFDASVWAKLYRRAGAQYGGPVTEHSDGFANFHTKLSHYNTAEMGPKRDIVSEVLQAVRAEGLKTVTTFHNHFLWGWYDTASPLFGNADAADPAFQLTPQHGGLYGQATLNESCGMAAGTGKTWPGGASSELFENYTMGKPAEAVMMFQPDLVYFGA